MDFKVGDVVVYDDAPNISFSVLITGVFSRHELTDKISGKIIEKNTLSSADYPDYEVGTYYDDWSILTSYFEYSAEKTKFYQRKNKIKRLQG